MTYSGVHVYADVDRKHTSLRIDIYREIVMQSLYRKPFVANYSEGRQQVQFLSSTEMPVLSYLRNHVCLTSLIQASFLQSYVQKNR